LSTSENIPVLRGQIWGFQRFDQASKQLAGAVATPPLSNPFGRQCLTCCLVCFTPRDSSQDHTAPKDLIKRPMLTLSNGSAAVLNCEVAMYARSSARAAPGSPPCSKMTARSRLQYNNWRKTVSPVMLSDWSTSYMCPDHKKIKLVT